MTDTVKLNSTDLINLMDENVRRTTMGWLIGQRSQHTRRAYARAIGAWARWADEHGIDPVNPGRQEIQAWVTWMSEIKGYKPDSVRQYHQAVKGWHSELAVEGCRPPLDVHFRLKLPKTDPYVSNTRMMTDSEVTRIIQASRTMTCPAETAITLMATMGLRCGEAAHVTPDMIESSPFGPVLRIVGKGNKPAILPLPKLVIMAALRVRWPGQQPLQAKYTTVQSHNDYNTAYRRTARWIEKAADRAGVGDFHPHMLRHWWITRALQLGVEERYVQSGARHASFDTTQRYNRAQDDLEHHPTFTVEPMLAGLLGADGQSIGG